MGHIVTPWLTGQRCLYSELLGQVSRPAAAGYGLETAITVAASIGGWRVQRVRLEGVYHPPSEFHRGAYNGIAVRARMYGQIIRAWVIAGGAQSIRERIQSRTGPTFESVREKKTIGTGKTLYCSIKTYILDEKWSGYEPGHSICSVRAQWSVRKRPSRERDRLYSIG